ncbi:hypothetical protein ACLKA7_015882 [Drosophila subpalustris]
MHFTLAHKTLLITGAKSKSNDGRRSADTTKQEQEVEHSSKAGKADGKLMAEISYPISNSGHHFQRFKLTLGCISHYAKIYQLGNLNEP